MKPAMIPAQPKSTLFETTMTPTVIPAQPDETAIEVFVENGVVVRQRKHRIIAWAIDYQGFPAPIGVTGLFGFESRSEGIFVYLQPGGGVQLIYPIWPIMGDYYESVEDAIGIGHAEDHRRDGDRESAATA